MWTSPDKHEHSKWYSKCCEEPINIQHHGRRATREQSLIHRFQWLIRLNKCWWYDLTIFKCDWIIKYLIGYLEIRSTKLNNSYATKTTCTFFQCWTTSPIMWSNLKLKRGIQTLRLNRRIHEVVKIFKSRKWTSYKENNWCWNRWPIQRNHT